MTKPQKTRTDLFQYLRSVLQNDKDTKKEELLIEKIGSIVLSNKKQDKNTLQLANIGSILISENLINILINAKNTKKNFLSFY